MAILQASSVSGFFHEVVEDAIKARRVEAFSWRNALPGGLLASYAHPTGTRGMRWTAR